jgi:hypothetical protein
LQDQILEKIAINPDRFDKLNPAGEEEFEDLLDELNTMRNALLHFFAV